MGKSAHVQLYVCPSTRAWEINKSNIVDYYFICLAALNSRAGVEGILFTNGESVKYCLDRANHTSSLASVLRTGDKAKNKTDQILGFLEFSF